MPRSNGRTPRWRSVVLIVAGIVIGSIFITPAVGHVGDRIGHLWNQHIKPKADNRYVNVGEPASDADLLDGTDSSSFLRLNQKAADSDRLDGLDSAEFFRSARVMFAQVGSNGALLAGASKGATGAAKVTTGRYNVDFPRNLLACSFVATVHDIAAAREIVAEYGEYAVPGLGFDTIRVAVNDSSGNPVDEPFSLMVLCASG